MLRFTVVRDAGKRAVRKTLLKWILLQGKWLW